MVLIQNLSPSFRIVQSDSLQFSQNLISRVDELWQAALSSTNSRLFNGLIFSAKEVTPDGIIGNFVEYKYLIAQHLDARLKFDLNIRPVSLLGFLTCQDGILFGRRQRWVATRPGEWGFLPSEYLNTDTFDHDGGIDYVKAFLFALKNELNIDAHFLNDLQHSVLVEEKRFDESHYSLVMQADIALSSLAVKRAHLTARDDEYEQIKALSFEEAGTFLAEQPSRDMMIASMILDKKGYLSLASRSA